MNQMAQRSPGRVVRLADVVRSRPGNSKLIKGKLPSHPGPGLYPAFSASGQDAYAPLADHVGNAVIVSAVGARCGKCFLASGQWSAIANTHVLLPDESQIDVRFLWYRVNDERFWTRGGSAQPFVRVRESLEREIFLPPLQEQKEIVAEIEKQFSRLDEAVANLKRVKVNLKRYRTATVDAAFRGDLFSTDAAFPTRQTAAQRLPAGWEIANVGRILKVRGGYAFRSTNYMAHGVPVVRQTDLVGEKVDIAGAKRLPDHFLAEYSAFLIKKGDLLIGMSGSLGKISEYVADEPALQNQRTGLLVMNQRVSPAFARLVLKFVEPQIIASGKGIAVQNVSAAQIEAATFPLPPPEEQARIVAEVDRRLSIGREIEADIDTNLARAQALRSTVLASAFQAQ